MDLDKYREDHLTKLSDEALEVEIEQHRRNLVSYDGTYADLREVGESPLDATLEGSQLARALLRLAERERSMRSKADYGSCPATWDGDEETPA